MKKLLGLAVGAAAVGAGAYVLSKNERVKKEAKELKDKIEPTFLKAKELVEDKVQDVLDELEEVEEQLLELIED